MSESIADLAEAVGQERRLPLGGLQVSPLAQREFRPDHATAIARNFQASGLGRPLVSLRDDVWWVVDGHHRIEALRLLGCAHDHLVDCESFTGLTLQQEAELFLLRNHRRSVSSLDDFRVAVLAGRQPYADIDRIVTSVGLRTATYPGATGLMAVKKLVKIHDRDGGAVLARALVTLHAAFGEDGLRAELLDGIALVLARFGGTVDQEWLIRKLAANPGGAHGLLGQARTTRSTTGRPVAQCVASCAVQAYNARAGRGGGSAPPKLTPWLKSHA